MRRPAVLFCIACLAAGCAGAPAPEPAAQTAKPLCAPLRAWSEEDLKALAAALAPIPAGSIVIRMALDWRRYYGDAKACDGVRER